MGTIWFGGKINTLRTENDQVEAIYVEDNKIKAMGKKNELLAQFTPNEMIDLQGSVMFPGFVDSHLHLIGHGEKLIRLDLSNMSSSKEISEALHRKVAVARHGEWIIGEGLNENQLPDRKIFHCTELDEISSKHPLIVLRVCRHALIANSMALALAGITKDTVSPPGGVIVKDADGIPTGYLLDQAQELVKGVIPPVSTEYLETALRESIKDCHRQGLVGGHSEDLNYYGGFERTYQSFLKVVNEGVLRFKTNLLVHHEVVEEMDEKGIKYGEEHGDIEIGAMKIFADGALGGRTALLSQPYNDAPETSGVAIFQLPQLKELVKKARQFNMPVAIHAIGDLAFEYAIDAIEEFPPLEGQRDRIIHAQIIRRDLIERVKVLPIVLDLQPRFIASDFPWVIERLGTERMEYCYAWKTLLSEGIPCSGGSDAPIEPVNPLLGIHAAVARRKPEDNEHVTYYPEQRLTTYEAVKLFTSGSAYAINREHDRGMIEVGYDADFTILNRDILTIQTEDILKTNVMMTVVDGEIVYERKV
jgi:predicted amidohydrolase YtcJ